MFRIACAILFITISQLSHALLIYTGVSSRDNLYQTDWGHVWDTGPNTAGAFDAQAVSLGGSAVDFSPFDYLSISTSGYVVDACHLTGSQQDLCKTNADGHQLINDPLIRDLYWTTDGLFRGHDVYSMVGIWSAIASSIIPISSTFQVGTLLEMLTPNVAGPHYLFLANNDGLFNDNHFSYTVQINALVSEPRFASLFLMGVALIFIRRQFKTNS